MTDFIVKAVKIDGSYWPLRAMLQSLDSPELGETEWWRRMAIMQNAAARAGDDAGELLWLRPEDIRPEDFGLLSIRRGVEKLLEKV